ncbi:transcriptional regulatory protein ZraR [bacterium BMS3Bbin14]|nr:transcriptional regulatory protein ZraR [bacterium BMS3Abin13]GBE52665.1 transcriptional regulatory protein ZraR [bacterium BMS3Bbin14]HDL98306.1 sigma-54-dependent Fis family transcriptional regulator [Desulfobacteraceae bacterium]HDO30720.1 sigma-54-dependent Fis family transcriptional regulator [Desulfobacteraceae bacterium]HDZ76055.1 sigma-54-dependent Fis family transcriptional regulator [Desulfobacteraceae bacterium]
MTRIVVIDDDPTACKVLTRMLQPDYAVVSFTNGIEAFNHFVRKGADIILTDLRMPGMDGFELLTRVKAVDPEVIVFMITGFSTVDSAVTAIKKGANDYIPKPFEPDDVLIRLERAIKEKNLEKGFRACQQERKMATERHRIITNHPKMLAAMHMAKKVARTDSTVLIQGETGVGKELIARMIHQWSVRKDQAFVPVNCSALSDGILESELFGHEKGAFTGAVDKRLGFFELADKGSILLDEIGATDHRFQVKLLRVLQDKFIYRVGSPTARHVDVRIIAATNQDLEKEARENLFRSDLYYRLSVVTIRLPPLRDRKEDVPLLAKHFVKKHRHINPRITSISPEGLTALAYYNYPGNVRELENIIERAMILENGEQLTLASLLMEPDQMPSPEAALRPRPENGENRDGRFQLKWAEREYILQVLQLCNGKKIEAAKLLGINKTTLWRKMKKYGIDTVQ